MTIAGAGLIWLLTQCVVAQPTACVVIAGFKTPMECVATQRAFSRFNTTGVWKFSCTLMKEV